MKKKSAVGNRVLAAFLATAMVGTYLPAIPAAAAGGDGDPAVLAQFTFDDAETGFAGGSAVAKVNGTYELRDSMDAENGKALYLSREESSGDPAGNLREKQKCSEMQAGGPERKSDGRSVLWRCGSLPCSDGEKTGHVIYILSGGKRVYGQENPAADYCELSIKIKRLIVKF